MVGPWSSVPLSGGQEGQTMSPGTGFTLGDTGGPLGITQVARNSSDPGQALISPASFVVTLAGFCLFGSCTLPHISVLLFCQLDVLDSVIGRRVAIFSSVRTQFYGLVLPHDLESNTFS